MFGARKGPVKDSKPKTVLLLDRVSRVQQQPMLLEFKALLSPFHITPWLDPELHETRCFHTARLPMACWHDTHRDRLAVDRVKPLRVAFEGLSM